MSAVLMGGLVCGCAPPGKKSGSATAVTVLAKGTMPAMKLTVTLGEGQDPPTGKGPRSYAFDGPTEIVTQRVEVPPGGTVPWHFHNGYLMATIVTGQFTQILPCDVETPLTSSWTEFPGHVHAGANRTSAPVVYLVTMLIPKGKPPRVFVDPPGCDEPGGATPAK